MNRIYCSTGAVIGRPNGRNIMLLKECQDKLACDGYEFLMYDTWYDKIDFIKEFMSDCSLSVPVFHVEKKIGTLISRNRGGDTERALDLFEINCDLAKTLGSKILVLHLWNGIYSDKDIQHNIEIYKHLRDISIAYELDLTIENVVCNTNDPLTNLKELLSKHTDARITFDTKMSEFHRQTHLLYKAENEYLFNNIRHMHINDYSGGYKDWENLRTLHPGEGNVDFGRLFKFLKEKQYKGDFTIEATSFDENGAIDLDRLNRSIDLIRYHLGQLT